MHYCWLCKPGLLFAVSGETLSFWLGGYPTCCLAIAAEGSPTNVWVALLWGGRGRWR